MTCVDAVFVLHAPYIFQSHGRQFSVKSEILQRWYAAQKGIVLKFERKIQIYTDLFIFGLSVFLCPPPTPVTNDELLYSKLLRKKMASALRGVKVIGRHENIQIDRQLGSFGSNFWTDSLMVTSTKNQKICMILINPYIFLLILKACKLWPFGYIFNLPVWRKTCPLSLKGGCKIDSFIPLIRSFCSYLTKEGRPKANWRKLSPHGVRNEIPVWGVRSKLSWSDPASLQAIYDQTQVHSIRLWLEIVW